MRIHNVIILFFFTIFLKSTYSEEVCRSCPDPEIEALIVNGFPAGPDYIIPREKVDSVYRICEEAGLNTYKIDGGEETKELLEALLSCPKLKVFGRFGGDVGLQSLLLADGTKIYPDWFSGKSLNNLVVMWFSQSFNTIWDTTLANAGVRFFTSSTDPLLVGSTENIFTSFFRGITDGQDMDVVMDENNTYEKHFVWTGSGPFWILTVSEADSQTINEDSSLKITPEMTNAYYKPYNHPEIILEEGDNYSISGDTIIPDTNYYGVLTVPVKAHNSTDTTESVNMIVSVVAVNDTPTLTTINALKIASNDSITLTKDMTDANDIENDSIIFILSDSLNYTVNGSTIIPDLAFEGVLQIPVRATDGIDTSGTVFWTINVENLIKRDSLALIALINANPDNTLNWDPSIPISTWDGVSFNIDGRVDSLEIGGHEISVIPSEFGNLTKLRQLICYWNKLTELPAEIGNLEKLSGVNFQNNKLASLPTEIGNLTNLWYLDCSNNQLHFDDLLLIESTKPGDAATRVCFPQDSIENFASVIVGDTVASIIRGDNNTSYQWFNTNNTTTPVSSNKVFIPNIAGNYICISKNTGLPNDSLYQKTIKVDKATAIEKVNVDLKINSNELLFVPNPVPQEENEIFMIIPADLGRISSIAIYDILGNVLDMAVFNSQGGTYRWDLCNKYGIPVASGTYVAVIKWVDSSGSSNVIRRNIGVIR